jgi:hypothetical protein
LEIQKAITSALNELGLEAEEFRPGSFLFKVQIHGQECPAYIETSAENQLCQFYLYADFHIQDTHRGEVCQFLNELNVSVLMDIGCAELTPDGKVRYRAALLLEEQEASPGVVGRIVHDARLCVENIQPKLPVVASSHGQRVAIEILREMHASAQRAEQEETGAPDEL